MCMPTGVNWDGCPSQGVRVFKDLETCHKNVSMWLFRKEMNVKFELFGNSEQLVTLFHCGHSAPTITA